MDALSGVSPVLEDTRRRELEAVLVLDDLPGVGTRTLNALIDAAGSAANALRQPALLRRIAGAAAAAGVDPSARARASRAVHAAERLGMTVLFRTDAAYPERLLGLVDPPPVLFLRGDAHMLGRAGVAIVGSRKATARAKEVAYVLGREVARAGRPVVSGMALGVDGAAHRGALAVRGPTVAVLGRGADRPYPPSHGHLFRDILDQGLAVTEFPPGKPPLPHHFPRRNRVLAGLCDTVVVVEARERSGALITVEHALDLGLDVWAVPGPIDQPSCAGSNGLLSDGARPLVSIRDFVCEVAGDAGVGAEALAAAGRMSASGEEGRVLACLEDGARSADEVARMSDLDPSSVLALLSRLELEGRVQRSAGMRFRRAG